MGIREMVQATGSPVILAVTAPKNNEDEQALGDQLFAALGLKLTGRWRTRKPNIMGHLHQFGTKLLIVDDAHDLSLEHLMFIKEITDQGRLQYDHPLGLCLVAAGRGNTIPLKEIFDQPETMWLQFRRRLDKLEPYCRISVSESANPPENSAQAPPARSEHVASHGAVVDQKQTAQSTKCTFFGMIPIDFKRFLESGVALVECPDCAATRTLEPHGGILRFKSHDKRKTPNPTTSRRWARIVSVWDIVGS